MPAQRRDHSQSRRLVAGSRGEDHGAAGAAGALSGDERGLRRVLPRQETGARDGPLRPEIPGVLIAIEAVAVV